MACISKTPANSYHFLRWYRTTSTVVADLTSALTYCAASPTRIPNKFVSYERYSLPVVIDGEDISFYANLDALATDADFANWRLSVFDQYGAEIVSSVAALLQDSFSGGFRFYTASFSVDSLTPATYRFVIYNSSTNVVKYLSNCFAYKAASDIDCFAYLEYRHSSTLDYFNYTSLTTLKNRIFLDFNQIEEQPEIEYNNYFEVSTGEVTNSKTYRKEVITIETGHFDYYMRQAMISLSSHDDIIINTRDYTVKEAYQELPSRANSLKKGVFIIYDKAASMINLNGYDA